MSGGAPRPLAMNPDGLTPSANDQRRLYGDLAWVWPIVSPPEDYAEESERLGCAIAEHAGTSVETLLHLGCGGGHNDYTFKQRFEVTGVDVSEPMLDLARRLNPEVSYYTGDMRAVELGKRFDAVVALDSMSYMLTEQDLRSVFATAYAHLNSGGVFVTTASEILEGFQQNKTVGFSRSAGDLDITHVQNLHDPDPTDTTYETSFVYFIRRGGRLKIETDRHVCGLFPLGTWVRTLRDVGFETRPPEYWQYRETEGYTVIVGLKG